MGSFENVIIEYINDRDKKCSIMIDKDNIYSVKNDLLGGNMDNISQDKSWKRVAQAVSDIRNKIGYDKYILLDFDKISLITPWKFGEFRYMLVDKRICLRLYNNDEIADHIKMMYVLDNRPKEMVINIKIEAPKKQTADEKKAEARGRDLINYFNIENGIATIDMGVKYKNINNPDTLDYVKIAINFMIKESDIRNFILDMRNVDKATEVVLSNLASMILEYHSHGIELAVNIEKKEDIDYIKLCLHKEKIGEVKDSDKFKIIFKSLKPGTVGILVKYKKTRAVDDFGRHGKGEPVSSRIAVFRGFKRDDNGGTPKFMVDEYKSDTFYTQQQWIEENDEEELLKLDCSRLDISMNDLGFGDEFLGASYHFMRPIQQSPKESRKVIYVENDERLVIYKCTLPERIKIVFESWGIKFDKEALENDIIETKKNLEKLENADKNKMV